MILVRCFCHKTLMEKCKDGTPEEYIIVKSKKIIFRKGFAHIKCSVCKREIVTGKITVSI